jgi:hypothetical protein
MLLNIFTKKSMCSILLLENVFRIILKAKGGKKDEKEAYNNTFE